MVRREEVYRNCKVRIKEDADEIMKRADNWSDSMEQFLGKIVIVKLVIDDEHFKSEPVDDGNGKNPYEIIASASSLEEILGAVGKKILNFTWTFECIDEVVEKPETKDKISLGEIIDLFMHKNELVEAVSSIELVGENKKLSDMMFHVSVLRKCLKPSIFSRLTDNGYRLDRKMEIESRIEEHETELKRLNEEKTNIKKSEELGL